MVSSSAGSVLRTLASGFRPLATVLCIASLLALAGCATAPTEYHAPALTAAERPAHNLAVFDRAWSLVNDHYFDPKFRGVGWGAMPAKYRTGAAAAADEDALYRVLNQMNAELKESHLSAFPPRRVHERTTEHQAAVGLRWQLLGGKRVVVDVVPGSPAAAAGVRLGWVATARNGAPIRDGDIYLPHVGQPVTYAFLDEHDGPRTLTLEPVLLNFVRRESHALPGGALYLRFDEFDRESLSWLSDHLKTRPPSVVIDLRSNPGGNALALSVAVAEFFEKRVPEGRLIQRSGAAREEHSLSWLSARYPGWVVLLTGRTTGSAAEIFSHVLQYHGRAKVVGQPTAGAVIYSRVWSLPGGGQIQVPIIDYLGLDGQRLEGRGVTPNVVPPAVTLTDLRAGRDPDLDAALKLLP